MALAVTLVTRMTGKTWPMPIALAIACCFLSGAPFAAAALKPLPKTDSPHVGQHDPIFVFEKNENPQNILIVYTKMDGSCHFKSDSEHPDQPVFDYYWLMDRKTFKAVNAMIRSGIRGRLELEDAPPTGRSQDEFQVRINDLKEMESDIKDAHLVVQSHREGEHACRVDALLTLGPADRNQVVRLDRIYSESKKTLWPPFRKVLAITIHGTAASDSSQEITRTFRARP